MEQSELESLNLSDLQELTPEEKESIKQKLDDICTEAENLEARAIHIADGLSKEKILHHAQKNKKTAMDLKQKIFISEGKQCFNPNEIELALRNSLLTAQNEEQLEARLKSNCNFYGLEFDDITPGNGNCFFEAICHQMEKLQLPFITPQALRKAVTEFIETNYVFQDVDGQVSLKDFVQDDFERYLQNMSMDGVYADHVIVLGTAKMLETDICIVTSSPDAVPESSLIWIVGKSDFKGNPFLLGHYWENHYQSLKPKGPQVPNIQQDPNMHVENEFAEEKGPLIPNIQQEPNMHVKKEYKLAEDKDTGNDMFLEWVRETFCKKYTDSETIVSNVGNDCSEEDFIFKYLRMAEENNEGIFILEHRNRKTTQYFCERHCAQKGKKKAADETRANNCPAYISFRVITHNGKKAVIIRRNINHRNHDITDAKEKKVSRIDPKLVYYIENLTEQEKKPVYIIVQCVKWSRGRGHFDVHDRKFYPTPVDVRNIMYSYRTRKRLHQNDAVAVEFLCTDVIKNSIVFYQRQSDNIKQPLIIVYQNEDQKERMDLYSKNVVFLDATYKGLTGYGYAFYCLLVRDNKGHGTPIAYMISSEDTSNTIAIFLQELKECARKRGSCFQPRSFMVDKDMKEVSAIKQNFPQAQILLCWFHVLQAVYRWLNKKESGVSGPQHTETRRKVVQYLREMKKCSTKDEFDNLTTKMDSEMPNQVVEKYLKDNWVPVGHMWSRFGRNFFHEDQETNNLVERFFLNIKYHFLGGYGNIRVEDLLLLIHENITTFYNYLDELVEAGRLKNLRNIKEARGKNRAEEMLRSGIGKHVIWKTEDICLVPSESSDTSYNVHIIKATCECASSTQGGLCKHIHLALMLAEQRQMDVTAMKQEIAKKIIDTNNYICDDSHIEIYYDGDISFVNIPSYCCTCIASSHNIDCVCVYAAKIINAKEVESVTTLTVEERTSAKPSAKQNIQTKLEEIYTWLHRGEMENTKNLENISSTVNKLHSEIFCSKFKKVSKKRKVQPIRIFHLKANDHSYNMESKRLKTSKDSVNEDGSFKTNRKKGSVRKPFQ